MMSTISYRLAESDGLYWIEQQIDEEPWTPISAAPMTRDEADRALWAVTADVMTPGLQDEGEA